MNKSTIVVGIIAVAALAAAVGAGLFAYVMTKPAAETADNLGEFDLTTVAGYEVAEGDRVLQLSHVMRGGNTDLLWEMAKNKENGDRQEFDGTWSVLTGGLVYTTGDDAALKAVEVIFSVESIAGYGTAHPAPSALINTVRGDLPAPAWFDLASHPEATFASSSITAREDVAEDTEVFDNAPDGWTHLITGAFSLNGETIDLSIPAVVSFIGESDISVQMAFQINRQTFGVDGTAVGGWVVEDIAYLTASVESAPKDDAMLAAIQAQSEAIAGMNATLQELARTRNLVQDLDSRLTSLQEELAELRESGVSVSQGPSLDDLEPSFTAQVQYPNNDPIEFDMVLVPGDSAGGIDPFYMAAHEVTWEMFYDWAYGSDIAANEYAQLQAQRLRPSPLYEDCDQLKLGLGNRPALSMSRTTAEAFAKWVSEQTGRDFRLPTNAEWEHAVQAGGGVPAGDALLAQAVFTDNAAEQDDPPFLLLTSEVGSLEPNSLGIYDLLGNAAEWVTDTGADRIVRGGHFLMSAGELTADWTALEDQGVWNATYPQLPLSEFWYRDHYYQGIRLVCEVE